MRENKKTTTQTVQKKKSNILVGFSVFVFSITTLVLVVFLIIIPVLNAYVRSIGGTTLGDLIRLYQEVGAHVSEEEMVTYGFNDNDFNKLTNKLVLSGLNVLDASEDNIVISKFGKNGYFNDLSLSDKELASMLNNILINNYEKIYIDIYNELELNIEIKQVKINHFEEDKFKVEIVVKANSYKIAKKLGILGGLLPNTVYLKTTAIYMSDGENLTFESADLVLNKVKDSSFEQLINIVANVFMIETDGVDTQKVKDFVAQTVCNYIKLFNESLNASWEFVNGGAIIKSNAI